MVTRPVRRFWRDTLAAAGHVPRPHHAVRLMEYFIDAGLCRVAAQVDAGETNAAEYLASPQGWVATRVATPAAISAWGCRGQAPIRIITDARGPPQG